jgi:hypothetical protein
VSANGSILYEAVSDGQACTLTFVREGGVLRATIVLLPDNAQPIIYEFTIQNLTTL